jgi:hypothetical protein
MCMRNDTEHIHSDFNLCADSRLESTQRLKTQSVSKLNHLHNYDFA